MVAIDMFVTDVTRRCRGDGKPSDSAHAHRGTSTVTASSVFHSWHNCATQVCADIVYRHVNITLFCHVTGAIPVYR